MTLKLKERRQINHLKDAFFTRCSSSDLKDNTFCNSSEINDRNQLSIDEFYDRLKQAHEHENFDNIPTNVQHRNLRPVLRPYQVKGIRWMLKVILYLNLFIHWTRNIITDLF